MKKISSAFFWRYYRFRCERQSVQMLQWVNAPICVPLSVWVCVNIWCSFHLITKFYFNQIWAYDFIYLHFVISSKRFLCASLIFVLHNFLRSPSDETSTLWWNIPTPRCIINVWSISFSSSNASNSNCFICSIVRALLGSINPLIAILSHIYVCMQIIGYQG